MKIILHDDAICYIVCIDLSFASSVYQSDLTTADNRLTAVLAKLKVQITTSFIANYNHWQTHWLLKWPPMVNAVKMRVNHKLLPMCFCECTTEQRIGIVNMQTHKHTFVKFETSTILSLDGSRECSLYSILSTTSSLPQFK